MLCEHKCEFNKHVTPDYGTLIKRVRQENKRNATSVKLVAYLHMHIFRTSCAFVLHTTILQYFTTCPSNSEMQKKICMPNFTHQLKIDVVWNTKNLRSLTLCE